MSQAGIWNQPSKKLKFKIIDLQNNVKWKEEQLDNTKVNEIDTLQSGISQQKKTWEFSLKVRVYQPVKFAIEINKMNMIYTCIQSNTGLNVTSTLQFWYYKNGYLQKSQSILVKNEKN